MSRLLSSLLLIAAFAVPAAAQQRKPSSHFTGDTLPEPPQQRQPWKAPADDVPATLTSAATWLFGAGLADPRGCEYRAVKVAVGNPWRGDGGTIRTNAWVLPDKDGTKQRFAVCWNGLVYPAISVGDKRDLKNDVLAIVRADEERLAAYEKQHGPNSFDRDRRAWGEGESASHESMLPLRACLLLRVGEGELAARLWKAWAAGVRPNINDNDRNLRDPFLMLATDWTWALFERGVCAHMRGDDRLALLSLRPLPALDKAVTAEALNRGFKQHEGRRGEQYPFLGFLEVAPRFLADQERRARERAAPPKPAGNKIAELVRRLEDVAAPQLGQPGGVMLQMDPIVKALVREGDTAVGPLLDCLESDRRLTRSVGFARDFRADRRPHSVAQAAFAALRGILQTDHFGDAGLAESLQRSNEGQERLAKFLRDYWKKNRGLSLEERWYRTLADAGATRWQWLEAARSLLRLAKVGGPAVEALRKKTPPVAELIDRCAAEVSRKAAAENSSDGPYLMRDACELAAFAAPWDGTVAVRAQVARARAYLRSERGAPYGHTQECIAPPLGELYALWAEGGEPAALENYAGWLRTLSPARLNWGHWSVFHTLYHHADRPVLAKAAADLFGDPRSDWYKAVRDLSANTTPDAVRSPLLGLRSFRKPILDALSDRTVVGQVWVSESRGIAAEVTGKWSGGWGSAGDDPLAPKAGVKVPLRHCDVAAWRLASVQGLTWVQPYWPEARRDEGIAELKLILTRYGDRFRRHDQMPEIEGSWASSGTFMLFPPLAGPATRRQVLQGEAIFSLEGEGKTRTVPLPSRPLRAKWVTLKKYPYAYSWARPKTGEHGDGIGYHQEGIVWQAEEVFVEGKWRRYYGFIGPGSPARVPAEEIEFPRQGWQELRGGFDCLLDAPEKKLAAGQAATVRLRVRNRLGVDREAPASLCTGLEVRVSYVPPEEGPALELVYGDEPEKNWRPLKPKAPPRFAGGKQLLRVAGELTAVDADLRTWFDLSRAGYYRVEFAFGGEYAGRSNAIILRVGVD